MGTLVAVDLLSLCAAADIRQSYFFMIRSTLLGLQKIC